VSMLGKSPCIYNYKIFIYGNHGSDLTQMAIKYTFFSSRKTFYSIYDNPSDHYMRINDFLF